MSVILGKSYDISAGKFKHRKKFDQKKKPNQNPGISTNPIGTTIKDLKGLQLGSANIGKGVLSSVDKKTGKQKKIGLINVAHAVSKKLKFNEGGPGNGVKKVVTTIAKGAKLSVNVNGLKKSDDQNLKEEREVQELDKKDGLLKKKLNDIKLNAAADKLKMLSHKLDDTNKGPQVKAHV